jgi:hypothetical protein
MCFDLPGETEYTSLNAISIEMRFYRFQIYNKEISMLIL